MGTPRTENEAPRLAVSVPHWLVRLKPDTTLRLKPDTTLVRLKPDTTDDKAFQKTQCRICVAMSLSSYTSQWLRSG